MHRKRKSESEDSLLFLAGAVRFELTEGYEPSPVFKTGALNRSATHPMDGILVADQALPGFWVCGHAI